MNAGPPGNFVGVNLHDLRLRFLGMATLVGWIDLSANLTKRAVDELCVKEPPRRIASRSGLHDGF